MPSSPITGRSDNYASIITPTVTTSVKSTDMLLTGPDLEHVEANLADPLGLVHAELQYGHVLAGTFVAEHTTAVTTETKNNTTCEKCNWHHDMLYCQYRSFMDLPPRIIVPFLLKSGFKKMLVALFRPSTT